MKAFRAMTCVICWEPIQVGEEVTRIHCGQPSCNLCNEYRHSGCPDNEQEEASA